MTLNHFFCFSFYIFSYLAEFKSHSHFKHSFNTHISSAVSTPTFQTKKNKVRPDKEVEAAQKAHAKIMKNADKRERRHNRKYGEEYKKQEKDVKLSSSQIQELFQGKVKAVWAGDGKNGKPEWC